MNRQDGVKEQVRAVYRAAHRTRETSPTITQVIGSVRAELGLVSGDGSLTDSELEWLIDELALDESSQVLDIGCGTGAVARYIATRTDCHVIGADFLWRRVESGQENVRSTGLANRVDLVQADADQGLGFASRSFDAVTLIDALIHFPDQHWLCTEIARVLRPGGRLAIVTVLGTELSEEQARVLEETTATLFRLELPQLVAIVEEARMQVCAQLDRTAQFKRWHQQRYDALQAGQEELVQEAGEQALSRMLERAETTVDLLAAGKLMSVILIAEKPDRE